MGFSNVFYLLLLLFSYTGDSGSGLICDAEDGRQPELVGKFLLFVHSRCILYWHEKERSWIAHEFLTHFSLSQGITSYGGVSCTPGSSGVYISVAHHKNWIDSVMEREQAKPWNVSEKCCCYSSFVLLTWRWKFALFLLSRLAFIIVSKIIVCTASAARWKWENCMQHNFSSKAQHKKIKFSNWFKVANEEKKVFNEFS